MRVFALSVFCLATFPSFAHVRHLGEIAGHSHWIGLGAIALAGVLAAVKGTSKAKEPEEPELVEEPAE
ncbi:MAG: DUF6732 family protein [Pseudomonadota bacterium]